MNVIISFTPNGMVPTKVSTPHVPVSVSEIVEDVHRATEIGITMVNLHARGDASGAPEWRADVYGQIIEASRRQAMSSAEIRGHLNLQPGDG